MRHTEKCKHNWKPDGDGGYICTKCPAWSSIGPGHFSIKQREHNPQSYRYIFTPKHHEALADYCAKLLLETNESADAWMAVARLRELLQKDNDRFSWTLWQTRIAEKLTCR